MKVKNYKISCKCPPKSLDWIRHRCTDLDSSYKVFSNFIVVYLPEKVVFSFFKNRSTTKRLHANVTGLKTEEAIERALDLLATFLKCCSTEITHNVDNITAVGKVDCGHPIVLDLLLPELDRLNIKTRLSRQVFAGLLVYNFNCTLILYPNGSIVVVGAKCIADIEKSSNFIKQLCLTVTMKMSS